MSVSPLGHSPLDVSPLTLHESVRDLPLADAIRRGGLSGCGGAGFPTYLKYATTTPYHLTNAQESEPGYYIDKWLHKSHAPAFAALYQHLLATGTKKIIIGAKYKDRAWFDEMERLTAGEVLDCQGKQRHDLDTIENPIVFCYTSDIYAFGRETALLLVAAQTKLPTGERPGQHGFTVNNSQTLFNLHRLLTTGAPVTRKYVHVYGETGRHAFLDAPIGTRVADALAAAGTTLADVKAKGHVVVEGGPGWFHRVDAPENAVVSRRCNALLVIDPAFRDPDGKNVLTKGNTPGYPRRPNEAHQQAPEGPLTVAAVDIPLIDNPALETVRPAKPCVAIGDKVGVGDVVADAAATGISIPCHASIDGRVTAVGPTHVRIEA